MKNYTPSFVLPSVTSSYEEKINWLRLARSENVGKATFFRLLQIFGSAHQALEKISDSDFVNAIGRKINIYSAAEAELELAMTKKFGAEIILFCEESYPRLLREIPDPAPILTIKGKKELFASDIVAIVGPRNASFNAINFTKKIATELGENSITVSSGLARGVDSAAHVASLQSGTIAVIAGGINHIYPRENDGLYQKIIKNGLLVSELPFGAFPKGGNFVQRNRIISGISLGVVVIEAGLKSGSLTTARFAVEQGREVFAMPGSPLDSRCHGTNRLIKEGAKMIENIDDILEEISGAKMRFQLAGVVQEPKTQEFSFFANKFPDESEVREIREEIFAKLDFTPIAIEEIIFITQASVKAVNIAIVQLELADKVEVKFGKVALKAHQS